MIVESIRDIDVDRLIQELDTKANTKQEDKKINDNKKDSNTKKLNFIFCP